MFIFLSKNIGWWSIWVLYITFGVGHRIVYIVSMSLTIHSHASQQSFCNPENTLLSENFPQITFTIYTLSISDFLEVKFDDK